MTAFTGSVVEHAALEWFGELGYRVVHGPENTPGAERATYEQVEASRRGEKLNLTPDELAFYDALEVNDSAVKVLGDDTLKTIARELVETVRHNVTIDWTVKKSVRAKLRVIVKRSLRKYGYPPDKQEAATNTVLQQAELLSSHWTAVGV